jgi:mitochondrial fission protein ELM1
VKMPLIIWLLCDGKPGHENQSLGLTDAMMRLTSCEIHRISIVGISGIVRRIKAASTVAKSLPKPDLIISAGHSTHPALLYLTFKYRALSIVLMRPSLPMSWFDFCIAPEHDFLKKSMQGNLIVSRGALNRVAPNSQEKTGRLLLIGGPSANHGWDGKTLLAALKKITECGHWQLTDSRRTPAGFLDEIRNDIPKLEIFSHQETTPDWLPRMLASAAEVWVTEDSVSMIYEALSSGAKVGLLSVPTLGSSRVQRGIDALVQEGILTRYSVWKNTGELPAPVRAFREADRCAALVLSKIRPYTLSDTFSDL